MRFGELIQNAHWKQIKRTLLEAYPDLDTTGYKHVFTQLRSLEPVENAMRIRLTKDPQTFLSENTQTPYKARPPEVLRVLEEGGFGVNSGLFARQPPDQTRLRSLINAQRPLR